jgi:HK97 family phage major capsid protein
MRIPQYMDPGSLPVIDESTLARIDKNVSAFIDKHAEGQAKIEARLEAQEKKNAEVIKLIGEHDEGLKDQKKILADVEGKVNAQRFNAGSDHGSDQLRNALPDDVRCWIPRVKSMYAGQVIGHDPDGGAVKAGRALARFANNDPVLFVACAAWFQARIKQALSGMRHNSEAAMKWHGRANDIAKAMGGFDDLQLKTLRAEGGAVDPWEPVQKADLAEGTDVTGGYLVPVITEAMIAALMIDASVVRGAGATVLQMTAPRHELPSLANDFGGATADLEGATIPDAAPASPFASGNLIAFRRAGWVRSSVELIQDSLINIMAFVMERMTRREGRWEDGQLLEGDGTIISGLFSVAGTTAVAGGSARMDVVKWGQLIYGGEEADVIDNGVVFTHPWPIRDLLTRPLEDASNNLAMPFMWATNIGQTGIRPKNLGGVPVYSTAAIARNRGGSTNETTMYHGDPSYIVIGDRMGIQFDVNPFGDDDFTSGKVKLRMLRRVGGLIWLPSYFTKLTAITIS